LCSPAVSGDQKKRKQVVDLTIPFTAVLSDVEVKASIASSLRPGHPGKVKVHA